MEYEAGEVQHCDAEGCIPTLFMSHCDHQAAAEVLWGVFIPNGTSVT